MKKITFVVILLLLIILIGVIVLLIKSPTLSCKQLEAHEEKDSC